MVSIKSALVALAISTTALAGVSCGKGYDEVAGNEIQAAPKDQLQKCIDELHARGTELCTIPAGQQNKGFVQIGTAEIVGVHIGGIPEEDSSSWCGHIADAAQEVLDQCGEGKDTADGSNQAYGNGDISVSLNYAEEK